MKFFHALLVTTILTTGVAAYASGDHTGGHGQGAAMTGMPHDSMRDAPKEQGIAQKNTVKLSLQPSSSLEAGKNVQVTAQISSLADGKSLTFDDLKEAHTKKLHLLAIDPSLSDYQHIHPVSGNLPGEFLFDFTPLKSGSYRVWADIIPVTTGKQEYVRTDIGMPNKEKADINKATTMTATVDGYDFTLSLDGEPKAGAPVMGSVTVTKDGKPFKELEPVMGAFAHVVGFTEDYNSVTHVHPMGKEPESSQDRGGPKLEFHIEPDKAGFVKLFAQVRIEGKDLFAPFGINVQ